MKIKITKCILALIAFTFVLTGCSNNDELASVVTKKTDVGYVVKDGYIKFDNKESYLKVYKKLSTASDTELQNWNSTLPIKSLRSVFAENIKSESIESDVDPLTPLSDIKDNALYSLLNEQGLLMCGDTIVKMKDSILYIIPNSDFTIVDKITNGEDISDLKNVIKQKFCTEIKPTPAQNPVGMQKLLDRSPVSYVTSTYRELVHYEANIIQPLFDQAHLEIKLSGVGQNLFIYWQPPFAHEMDYGRIVINGETWVSDTHYPYTFDSDYVYNNKWVTHNIYLGYAPFVRFDLYVNYTYKMNNLSTGQGGTQINYKYTQF